MTDLSPAATDSGDFFRSYEMFELLGKGGMGAVYRGRQKSLDRDVAIKVVQSASGDARFLREARLAAKVRSPHAVTVIDFQLLPDGRAMLVMELVQGRTLNELIESDGALSDAQTMSFMRDAAHGMSAVSEIGIVHRDLKPSNLLIDDAGSLRVADFGIARLHDVDADSAITATGVVVGTPHYMAPEQAEDPRSVDVRSDIYSFGATFYHATTGHLPFEARSPLAVLVRHKLDPLVSPMARRPEIDRRISEIIERCMAKQPIDRFQTFEEVLAALEEPTRSPWAESDDPVVRHLMEQYQSVRATILEGAGEPGVLLRLYHKGRVLEIFRGDLARSRADAIVSSDDESLSMGGGVSGHLNAASGDVVRSQARMYERVRHGGVVVTGAGDLRAKYVFHAVTIDYLQDAVLAPSRDVILQLMAGCFYHAQSLMVESIAFPLLGTGAGGLERDVALDTMVAASIKALRHGAHGVERVTIVIR
jgi:eukaryotic-like serine/threonine-protein kinase